MRLSFHLVSDLDGTWLPDAQGTAGLYALEAFLAAEPGIVVTFATGRTFPNAVSVLSPWANATARHLVTDVGTFIHHRGEAGAWVEDADYARWVDARWDHERAERLVAGALPPGVRRQSNVPERRRLALEVEDGIEPRGPTRDLRRFLERSGFVADVLPSNGRCLDVLPKGVHKGTAIRHLRTREALPSPLVVCGDSENDLGMLQLADVPVIMGNGLLKARYAGLPTGRLIIAAPGPAGILEVLRGLASSDRRERGGAA